MINRLPKRAVADNPRTLDDGRALTIIAEILRDPDWGVGMLEDIAVLVAKTGRDLSNPDDEPTWDRH